MLYMHIRRAGDGAHLRNTDQVRVRLCRALASPHWGCCCGVVTVRYVGNLDYAMEVVVEVV